MGALTAVKISEMKRRGRISEGKRVCWLAAEEGGELGNDVYVEKLGVVVVVAVVVLVKACASRTRRAVRGVLVVADVSVSDRVSPSVSMVVWL